MSTTQATPTYDTSRRRFKGSLAGTLVRTLLIFTFIPLALMAGAAYLRTRALLQEQAITQSQHLLATQIEAIEREIANKETYLNRLLESSDFRILTELALHANPKSGEFREIRNGIIVEFNSLGTQEDAPSFNQFLLLDSNRNIKISSKASWQGLKFDASILERTTKEHPSTALYGIPPLYENEFILITAQPYKTARGSMLGYLVGITEKKSLQKLTQPLTGLSPLATTYFVLPDGQFIHSDPATGGFAPVEFASRDTVNAVFTELTAQSAPSTRTLEIASTEGENALAQLRWFPKMQTGVVLQVKSSDIYGEISSLLPFTSILTLLTLLAMGLVLIIGINRVVKPLRALSEITHSFTSGDWSRRAEVKSNDEIGVLANSFNQMADELGKLYRSLEHKVDEGERHIRTTAEVTRNITDTASLNQTFEKTVELLVKQFGFLQANIYIVDRSGGYAEFKSGFGEPPPRKNRLAIDPATLIGWVCTHNQPHTLYKGRDDALNLQSEPLPNAHSETVIPISMGTLVLGVLDVQSTEDNPLSPETALTLHMLSNQIATAIQAAGLAETSQVNFEELSHLYRASRLIAKADTEQEIFEVGNLILGKSSFHSAILRVQDETLRIVQPANYANSCGRGIGIKIPPCRKPSKQIWKKSRLTCFRVKRLPHLPAKRFRSR